MRARSIFQLVAALIATLGLAGLSPFTSSAIELREAHQR
jgi:hypothetical protein